jgi:hypothetical protein
MCSPDRSRKLAGVFGADGIQQFSSEVFGLLRRILRLNLFQQAYGGINDVAGPIFNQQAAITLYIQRV